MNRNVLVVDITSMTVYDFIQEGETQAELLKRANKARNGDIETWSNICTKYPDANNLIPFLERAKKKNYQVMGWRDYKQAKKEFFVLKSQLTETTEEVFHEMLNVLPPSYWMIIKGVEMFCIREMITDTFTSQYARLGDKYYTKVVDVLDESTWIYNFLF